MNYLESLNDISINVQAPRVDVTEAVQGQIRKSVQKISKFADKIMSIDFNFNISGSGKAAEKILGMRVRLPGKDVFADDRGTGRWASMLRNVTDKNIGQLQRGK